MSSLFLTYPRGTLSAARCSRLQCVLSVIIISAVLGLFDFKAAWLIWKTDKLDFCCLLGAFFGVVFKSVEIGILIAVSISIAKLIFQVTRPHTGQCFHISYLLFLAGFVWPDRF